MKSFRQFIIEKKRETLPDPFDADYEKKIGEIEKKNINKNQKKGEEVLKDIEKKKPRQNRKTKSNQSSSPEAKAKAQAIKDIQDTGGTDPRFKRSGEGEFSKGGGKFKEPVKPEQAKGSKTKPGSVPLGDTTKGSEVRTNKPKSLQGRKELLKRSFNLGNRSDKYKTNKPPTGQQVQQFAKDITGKAADDKSGVGGTKGVGQTKSLKGQTLTGGKYKGATPIDKRSAAELRKFAKDASATKNPLSGKTQKSTLKSAAKRVNQKLEDAKKAASKQTKRLNKAQAYTKKINDARIKREANKIIEKLRRVRKNETSGLSSRMSSASEKLKQPIKKPTEKQISAYKNKLQSKGDKVIEKIRRTNRVGTPKSTVINTNSSGQTSLFPELEKPPKTKTQGFRANNTTDPNILKKPKNYNPNQTVLDFNKKTPKVTKNPQKTYNQFQKDISRIRGKKSNFTKANLLHQVTKVTNKVPKLGVDPFSGAFEYARQRDQKNATPKRAIAGGTINAISSYAGFKKGASTAAKIASPLLAAPFPGARPLYGLTVLGGGIGGQVLATKATQTAFDQALGKKGTRVTTKTQNKIEKEKNKTKTKVITANQGKGKNTKAVVPPTSKGSGGFGLNLAK